ncbi:MAG: GTPase ObgE [Peptococcaceae bacterium BICA1-7]|nr:MAG: GTPase ObgE [Peptococcaceae bacterium BICA1-7]HBV97014.1 GTPase ObgE [Desulfotomaculum sp.]
MFYDKSKIYVKGGDGGNGCMAFRREKYVPEGGPWGGDGGRGGDVIFTADEGLRTLVDFRYQRHYKAGRGQHGMGKNMHGRTGEDLVLRVPVGTVVREAETGRFIGDLTANGQELVVARGGRGGRGNARFATMINKAPKMCENGEPGEELWLSLELKLLADVGLVGLPNAGKSSLITSISAARPKIADYPFTTIVPNLGMVRVDEGVSFVVADIPGLIEGAHTGTGLGHEFLRHVERTRVLVHVVDISGGSGNPAQDFEVINRELSLYNPRLAEKPMIVAANKIDMPDSQENLDLFAGQLGNKYEIYPISALTGEGVGSLVNGISRLLASIPAEDGTILEQEEEVAVHEVMPRFTVEKKDGVFTVSGREIERHLAMTNLDNEEALARLQRIMSIMGIDRALSRAGAQNGDTVVIKNFEFEYTE